ncbi:MAG: vWA domain-containing protein [Acidimicrobiales bacterium]
MVFATPPRSSRRWAPSTGGPDLDVRATLHRARRSGGEPLVAVRRRPRCRPRRLVLICDVSGSMEPYARAYLHLMLSGVAGGRAEAFVFATRLTRLTRALRSAPPDQALVRAGRAAPDGSGGTRIGAAVKSFNDRYGRRGVARGAVVVILSDGWDRGDPSLLAREMAALYRLAHRVVWVNPRKAAPGFEPLTSGMAAALPHVDNSVSGHSLDAFDEVLGAIGSPVPVRSGAPGRARSP